MPQEEENRQTTVAVKNIGGIDNCEIEFKPGLTILTGRNATNRTSLLSALGSALGGTTGKIKSDAECGFVKLEIGDATYKRRYKREETGVTVEGQSYTDNASLVDLFACLLETNPARQAIERGENLREIIMKPVDTEAIQRSIRQLEEERTKINNRIKEIRDDVNRLPALEERQNKLENERSEIDDQLQEARAAVDEFDIDPERADAAEEAIDELERLRQSLSQKQSTAATHRDTLEALRVERDDLESELDNLNRKEDELEEVDSELSRLQERERTLADIITDLAAIVDFNQDFISGDGKEITELGSTTQDVTAKLNPEDETVECWTCGSEVLKGDIVERIAELNEVIEDRRTERQNLQERIETLRERRSELQSRESRKSSLERDLNEVESDITHRENQLEDLEEELELLKTDIKEQETRVRQTEEFRNDELLDRYEKVTELEYERGQLEQRLSEVSTEIEELERQKDELKQLDAQRDEIQDELESQRTKVKDLEQSAIESFNSRMAEILDLLGYENLERVWIERKEGTEFDSRRGGYRGGSVTSFDLHIIRSTEDDTVYEDTIDTLSESEREVIGLVVALAGYLVHRVYETVPMMLLDSLEAIDADRIARLLEYFADHAEYLVVALLPEDAQALDDRFTRISASDL